MGFGSSRLSESVLEGIGIYAIAIGVALVAKYLPDIKY
jgi:hypothetical protein